MADGLTALVLVSQLSDLLFFLIENVNELREEAPSNEVKLCIGSICKMCLYLFIEIFLDLRFDASGVFCEQLHVFHLFL